MRLTLRTVLAYVDDQLEPIQAREIGARIAESKEASELVARIREVIRRRRTGAPELAGPGSGPDPNLVADYLENVLPPAQVYELERLCQSSDVHLAEIAGCHKILTMVLGQPLEVSEQTKQRMYALGSRKVSLPVPGVEASSQPQMTDGIGVPVKAGTPELPEYLRGSRPSRFWPMTLVILIGAAWCSLIATDPSLWPTADQLAANLAQTDIVGEERPASVSVEPIAEAPAEPGRQANAATAGTPPATPSAQESSRPVVSINPAPPRDAAEPAPNDLKGPATVMPAPVRPLANGTPPAEEPITEELPPVKSLIPVNYRSGDGVLLHLPTRQKDWRVAAVATSIQENDEFASPAPFRGTVTIGQDLELILEPGTRLKRLGDSGAAGVAFLVDRGQLVLNRLRTSTQEISVTLTVNSRAWVITPLDPGTRCGVELFLPQPQGPPGPNGQPQPDGGISLAGGRLRIAGENQAPLDVTEAGSYLPWPIAGQPLTAQMGTAVPLWLLPEGSFVTPASRNLARLYEKEFQSDPSVVRGIGPVVRDRRASVSELAAQTLSLIDEYTGLVSALAADHEETRIAAIRGLRIWLLRDPANAALLADELQRHFPRTLVDSITRLLWGYGPEDARNPEISKALVAQLQDPDLVIRELAFFHLSELTGKRYDYLPMAPNAERRAAATRWEDHLKRNGGALLPKQQP